MPKTTSPASAGQDARNTWHEVWSCAPDGNVERHGGAFGLTFEDACKHLACESLDFWNHYEKGRYRGRLLCPSRGQALALAPPGRAKASSAK